MIKNSFDAPAERAALFDMPIDAINIGNAADEVLRYAEGPHAQLVVTPNTDHFLRWQRSPHFRRLYSHASLIVPDGMPVVWAAKLSGIEGTTRVTGVDLFTECCRHAAAAGIPVALVGGLDEAPLEARRKLSEAFPGLEVYLAESPPAGALTDPAYMDALADRLAERDSKIVALCLGSPKQEEAFVLLRERAGGGAYLGVGAAVDFWAGNVRRAPSWMQRCGMEWSYRLLQEPRRLWRRYLVEGAPMALYLIRAALGKDHPAQSVPEATQ